MAKKIKEFDSKVSVTDLDKAIKENYEPTKTITSCGIEICVKKHLNLQDFVSFVNMVTDGCFDSEGNYMPEARDFYVRKCIIEKYTNVSLPSSTEKMYDVLYQSNIVEDVINAIDGPQFNELLWSLDTKRAYVADGKQKINKVLNDIAEVIDGFKEKVLSVYSGISEDDIQKLAKALGKVSEMDEDKLIEAIASLRTSGENNG